MEDSSHNLHLGEVMAIITLLPNKTFQADYLSIHSGARFFLPVSFRNDTVFTIAAEGKWRKLKSYKGEVLAHLKPRSNIATGQLYDSNNYVLTIPISSSKNVEIIDSIIRRDSSLLSRTSNLIIDIRGNAGGKSAAFAPLLPWIYTNPINRVSASTYATEDGIRNYQQRIAELKKAVAFSPSDDSEVAAWTKMLQDSLGHFVFGGADTLRYDSVRSFPRNVAVITDYACQSAAELLVLTFRQSRKVLFFGEQTMGAVDYLDFYPMHTPSGQYTLLIATSKRTLDKYGPLDGKGLAPDIRISDNDHDWVKHVVHYYEKL